jgi:hypothetical protein
MRKRKTIKVDDREITVKELTVKEILEIGNRIADQDKAGDVSLGAIKAALGNHLGMGVEGVQVDDLMEMAPSEIDSIYQAFKEVNAVFFEVAQQAGLKDLLRTLQEAVKRDFLKSLAAL